MLVGIAHIALLVRDYDEAIDFYCNRLGCRVVEDIALENKRWVRLKFHGDVGSDVLLSKAVTDEQRAVVGKQAGGRVFLFIHTDSFDEDYLLLRSKGVQFSEGPFERPYGKVAVFEDLYGNRIDLVQRKK